MEVEPALTLKYWLRASEGIFRDRGTLMDRDAPEIARIYYVKITPMMALIVIPKIKALAIWEKGILALVGFIFITRGYDFWTTPDYQCFHQASTQLIVPPEQLPTVKEGGPTF
ncbi:hypothetical protein TNCV_4520511 [Trichonephila clavipes]|nr:hypothetical protein TNCV_4520511 [Trichonephila clavipes]